MKLNYNEIRAVTEAARKYDQPNRCGYTEPRARAIREFRDAMTTETVLELLDTAEQFERFYEAGCKVATQLEIERDQLRNEIHSWKEASGLCGEFGDVSEVTPGSMKKSYDVLAEIAAETRERASRIEEERDQAGAKLIMLRELVMEHAPELAAIIGLKDLKAEGS